jgi:hypothetical protein
VNAAGILVGGVIPALFLGLGTVLMRSSIAAGASIPTYLAVIGTTVALVGWTSLVLTGQSGGLRISGAVGWAVAMALAWSAAIACISYGFGTLKLPVAVVAPLTNANALVAVTVGALAFGEWRSLNLSMTTGGTLLICVGATLVSLSISRDRFEPIRNSNTLSARIVVSMTAVPDRTLVSDASERLVADFPLVRNFHLEIFGA